MGLWRCTNCTDPDSGDPGRDFEGPKPVCPECGADRDLVAKVEVIHLDPPSRFRGRGLRHAACDPKVRVNAAGSVRMTGVPSAVTCRRCRATPAWRAEAERWGDCAVPGDADFELGADEPRPTGRKGG